MSFARDSLLLLLVTAALLTSCRPAATYAGDSSGESVSSPDSRRHKLPKEPSDRKDFPLPQGWPRPVIKGATVRADARVGLNLHLVVENFDFAPDALGSKEPNLSRHKAYGFVHLYINGRKKNRIYGCDFYLKEDELEPGVNDLKLVLGTPGYGAWLGAEPLELKVERPTRTTARPSRKPRRQGPQESGSE